MQSVSELTNLQGKKVILRLDLNVPLNNGEITDTTRIDKVLPTIEFLLEQNSKIVKTTNEFRVTIISFFGWEDPVNFSENFLKKLVQP